MAQNLDLNVNVNVGSADNSIGSLRKQLRDAQNDVQTLSDKFGATSKEAINAAKRAAELRDKIGDARSLVDAFNPDAKFRALSASLSGVAGGFSAVQGAMALFGNESENVQKTLLKVQSAMALSQGLQSVGESVDSFKQLGAVIKTQVITAFSTLKGAIAATGIGALVVGLGLLITNFEKVKEHIFDLFPSLEKFAEKFNKIIQSFTDFIGITSEQTRKNNELKSSIEAITNAYDMQIAELEAQGGREDEVYKLKKQRIDAQLKAITGATDKEILERARLNSQLRILDLQEAKRLKEIDDAKKLKEQQERKAQKEKDDALQKTIAENRLKEIEYNQKVDLENNEYLKGLEEKENERLLKAEQDRYDFNNRIIQNQIDSYNYDKEYKEFIRNEEIQADKQLYEAKWGIAEAGLNVLASLATKNEAIANTLFVIDKAMAIGKIVVDTQKEISGYWSNPLWSLMPDGGASIKTAYSTAAKIRAGIGIASIAATTIAKFKGNSSPSINANSPSITQTAPIAPQLPQTQMTQLNQQSINDLGNQAIKTYVVESDMTTNQQRIAAIRQRARFS